MSRLARFTRRFILAPLTAGAGVLVIDDHYNSHRVQRNLRALYASLRLVYEYKINWSADKMNSDVHRRAAKLILNCCQQNGGLYIKFGQGIASMNHILPREYREEFQVLHDHAPSVGYPEIRKIILEDLKVDPNLIFSSFDPIPVASASIAQVHKAVLHSGESVAVKIQKPYIASQVPWDLFFYRVTLHIMEYAFELPLIWSTDFTERQMLGEVDFVSEAMNSQKTAQLLNNDKYIYDYSNKYDSHHNEYIKNGYLAEKVYVPKLYPAYCSKRVLTAEWCDGVKCNDIEEIKRMGVNLSDVMHTVVSLFGYQIFVTGVVHCDPHPGNILVRSKPYSNGRDYQLIFLDHGLYIEEPQDFRMKYSQFWVAMLLRDLDTLNMIGQSWGVHDVDFFAAMQLQKPFSSKRGVWDTKKLTKDDIVKIQKVVKKRVQKVLKHTQTIPRHLIFVGRNMNIVRANNRDLGSAVNRVGILAEYAAKGASLMKEKGKMYYYKYKLNQFGVSLWYNWTSAWKYINDAIFGIDKHNVSSFEDELEEQMLQFAQEIGIIVDIDARLFDS